MNGEPFSLTLAGGGELVGLLDRPASPGAHPAVVVCHGFKGFARWGFFPPLAWRRSRRGGSTRTGWHFSATAAAERSPCWPRPRLPGAIGCAPW